MNYPAYNPYTYNQFGPQQAQQGAFLPQGINQPGQMQAPPQAQQATQGLSQASRPVTSKEEAMGVAADFSGAPMVFPDVAHNKVYVKRWNFQAGAADFIEFAPVIQPPAPQEVADMPLFASIQQLRDLQNTVDAMQQEIERLKRPQNAAKTPVKKDKGESNE